MGGPGGQPPKGLVAAVRKRRASSHATHNEESTNTANPTKVAKSDMDGTWQDRGGPAPGPARTEKTRWTPYGAGQRPSGQPQNTQPYASVRTMDSIYTDSLKVHNELVDMVVLSQRNSTKKVKGAAAFNVAAQNARVLGILVAEDIVNQVALLERGGSFLLVDTTLVPPVEHRRFKVGTMLQVVGPLAVDSRPFVKYVYTRRNGHDSARKGILQYNQEFFRAAAFLNRVLAMSLIRNGMMEEGHYAGGVNELAEGQIEMGCFNLREYTVDNEFLELIPGVAEQEDSKGLTMGDQTHPRRKPLFTRRMPEGMRNIMGNCLVYRLLERQYKLNFNEDKTKEWEQRPGTSSITLSNSSTSGSELVSVYEDDDDDNNGEESESETEDNENIDRTTEHKIRLDNGEDSTLKPQGITREMVDNYNSRYPGLPIIRARIVRAVDGLDVDYYHKSFDIIQRYLVERQEILKD